MKKIILLFLVLNLFAATLNGQSFIFKRTSPPLIIGDTSLMFATVGHAILKNTSSNAVNYKIVRIFQPGFPSSWDVSLCCKAGCFSSELDTIPPSSLNYTLAPNETDSTVAIDLYGMVYGTGSIILKVFVQGNPSAFQQDTFTFRLQSSIGITPISSQVSSFELKQNYPNPFNPSTIIEFSVPKSTEVTLKIYNSAGIEVANLLNGRKLNGGKYRYDFNAADYNLTSGVYFCSLITTDYISTKKMLLIK